MRRRTFIKATGLGAVALASGLTARAAAPMQSASVLPVGNAPAPLPLPHFPSRLHAFVWRNWPLVRLEQLAKVVGATSRQLEEVARAMGLKRQPRITDGQLRRSHITIIKRNWHLLPYEQLLALLGWTPEKLAYILREDDFLYIKLGNHKPKCEPLRWSERTQAIRRHESEIARIAQDFEQDPEEPLFAFVEKLSSPLWFPKRPETDGALRLCYSYFALYGDPLLEADLGSYPDGYLARLSESGVNAVWLQGVLHKLAPFPWEPALSGRYEERIQNLKRLVARAKKRGIAIYIYLNEPRALPASFFAAHPQLKGVSEGEYSTLCTSVPEVQRWMRDVVAQICMAAPELGGFFTISASENLTNCWSHGAGAKCPRCSKEGPANVIARVNGTIQEGIERARSRLKNAKTIPQLIAWDWGWNDAWVPEAIRQLPQQCALMSVSEWNLPIQRGGVKSIVGEYSISSIGPGPRAKRHWDLAKQRGLKVIAKIQANNSWELSSVPYIPALENVAQHAANLREAGVADVMLGWTLGGCPSPNLEIVQQLLRRGSVAMPAEALSVLAKKRFGRHAGAVLAAWHDFSAAFSEFPYSGGVVYSAPQQVGAANLLFEKPTGYRATMVCFPYDDVNSWRSLYPVDVFIAQFEKVADGFRSGVQRLREARSTRGSSAADKALFSELTVASAAEVHFRSVANQARFVRAREALTKAKTSNEAQILLNTLEGLLKEEIVLARAQHRFQQKDSRIGFEASNQYYYIPVDLMEKILNCRDLLERWLPAERAKWI
jgi:hypothetical protein